MRISLVLPAHSPLPIGGYRVVYEYANRLARRGHRVTLIHASRLRNIPQKLRQLSALVARIRHGRAWFLRARPGWQQLDGRVTVRHVYEPTQASIPDGDAVIGTLWATTEYVLEYPLTKGQKFYLIQGPSEIDLGGAPRDRVDRLWRSRELKKVVVARWLYERALSLGVEPGDVRYIPNAVDTQLFRLIQPIKSRSCSACMMFGSETRRGSWYGVEALEIVRAVHPEFEATLFSTERRPPGIPTWMKFVTNPAQDHLAALYNASRFYVCSSLAEGWHLPPTEAMACGCALITADIPGVRDYATHGVTALLCPPEDSSALAQHLLNLLDDDQQRIALAQKGWEFINGLSWERSVTLLEEFIQP